MSYQKVSMTWDSHCRQADISECHQCHLNRTSIIFFSGPAFKDHLNPAKKSTGACGRCPHKTGCINTVDPLHYCNTVDPILNDYPLCHKVWQESWSLLTGSVVLPQIFVLSQSPMVVISGLCPVCLKTDLF